TGMHFHALARFLSAEQIRHGDAEAGEFRVARQLLRGIEVNRGLTPSMNSNGLKDRIHYPNNGDARAEIELNLFPDVAEIVRWAQDLASHDGEAVHKCGVTAE